MTPELEAYKSNPLLLNTEIQSEDKSEIYIPICVQTFNL